MTDAGYSRPFVEGAGDFAASLSGTLETVLTKSGITEVVLPDQLDSLCANIGLALGAEEA